jgi:hypothetical protein
MRKLQDGSEVPELDEPKVFTIKTRCPQKWLLVDRETGEVYSPYDTDGSLQWKKQSGWRFENNPLGIKNA